MNERTRDARATMMAGLVAALLTSYAHRASAAPPGRATSPSAPSSAASSGAAPGQTGVPPASPGGATSVVSPGTSAASSGISKANEARASNEMRAEQLFRAGEKKFDSGQYAEACNDFAESLRFGPKLGTLLNLALCHETIGKVATAWREFHHGAAWAAQNGQRERHDFAAQHAVALETKLPRVLLQLPSERAIATVEVDGEPLPESRWYLPVFIDPGEHAVAITVPGSKRGTVAFRVINSPTEQIVIVSAPPDETPAEPPRPLQSEDPHRTRRVAGWVTLGVGAVGLAVGATFGVIALTKNGDADAHCVNDVCDSTGARLHREAGDNALVSTVGFALGAAAGAVGGYLVLTSPSPKDVTGLRLSVKPVAGGASFGLSRSF